MLKINSLTILLILAYKFVFTNKINEILFIVSLDQVTHPNFGAS